jgi:hypothetical protein
MRQAPMWLRATRRASNTAPAERRQAHAPPPCLGAVQPATPTGPPRRRDCRCRRRRWRCPACTPTQLRPLQPALAPRECLPPQGRSAEPRGLTQAGCCHRRLLLLLLPPPRLRPCIKYSRDLWGQIQHRLMGHPAPTPACISLAHMQRPVGASRAILCLASTALRGNPQHSRRAVHSTIRCSAWELRRQTAEVRTHAATHTGSMPQHRRSRRSMQKHL